MKYYKIIAILALAACQAPKVVIEEPAKSANPIAPEKKPPVNNPPPIVDPLPTTPTPTTPKPCAENYTTGKTFENAGVISDGGYGNLKLIFTDDCKISIPNCSQTVLLPENLNLQLDQVSSISVNVEITGTAGRSGCPIKNGTQSCSINLYTHNARSNFTLNCDNGTTQYAGSSPL